MPDDTFFTTNNVTKADKSLQHLRREWPLALLNTLLVGLLVGFVAVMFHDGALEHFQRLLGLSQKNAVLTFLGLGMGGLLVALQALMSYKRAKAMEDAARAQAEAASGQAKVALAQTQANVYVERGQKQQRLNSAIEHLGDESVSVRLGGAYELFALAQDNEHLRKRVLRVLCAHICALTRETAYQEAYASNPSAEVQNLLTLLFNSESDKEYVFEGCTADLSGSWLNGAQFSDAYMPGATLDRVCLKGARLDAACLHSASLVEANLQGADLVFADLSSAYLFKADLLGVCLSHARLQTAQLNGAQLQGAVLCRSHWEGADLSNAKLQGTDLKEVQFQGATFDNTAFHGVHSDGEYFDTTMDFRAAIRRRIDQQTDESNVTFSGGISQETVEELTGALGSVFSERLKNQLKRHVGRQRSNRPPEGVVMGTYTRAEAEAWIARADSTGPCGSATAG